MSYISEIFERANIQRLTNFLITGQEISQIDQSSYEDRIELPNKKLNKMIDEYVPHDIGSEMGKTLLILLSNYENVYLEIGLRIGLYLALSLSSLE